MTLDEIDSRYAQEIGKMDAERDQQAKELRKSYLTALMRLEQTAQKSSNLDMVLAVRSEIELVSASAELSEISVSTIQDLGRMQTALKQRDTAIRKAHAEKVISLTEKVSQMLQRNVATLTKKGDTTAALKWREHAIDLMLQDTYVNARGFLTSSAEENDPFSTSNGGKAATDDTREKAGTLGKAARIVDTKAMEFARGPTVYKQGSEPQGREKRTTIVTPSMKGAGIGVVTAQVLLIEESEEQGGSYRASYERMKVEEHLFVPRIKIAPLPNKPLEKSMVVFDLYTRGKGSKREIVQTDKVILKALDANERVVVDAGKYTYKTQQYRSRYFADYDRSDADEFYGFVVSIFDASGNLFFQRATNKALNDFARTTPPE